MEKYGFFIAILPRTGQVQCFFRFAALPQPDFPKRGWFEVCQPRERFPEQRGSTPLENICAGTEQPGTEIILATLPGNRNAVVFFSDLITMGSGRTAKQEKCGRISSIRCENPRRSRTKKYERWRVYEKQVGRVAGRTVIHTPRAMEAAREMYENIGLKGRALDFSSGRHAGFWASDYFLGIIFRYKWRAEPTRIWA